MTAAVVRLLAVESESHGRDLPLEPWAFGLIAFGLLTAAMLVTLMFGKDR
jgi:hypothetical protein